MKMRRHDYISFNDYSTLNIGKYKESLINRTANID